MNIPVELSYTKTHEWLAKEGNLAIIGVTDYAQSELGDLVYINLPQVGQEVTAGEQLCDVESVKAVSDVISPVTGVVVEVNDELESSPETINSDPYGAWICKVEFSATEELLTADEYAAQL